MLLKRDPTSIGDPKVILVEQVLPFPVRILSSFITGVDVAVVLDVTLGGRM